MFFSYDTELGFTSCNPKSRKSKHFCSTKGYSCFKKSRMYIGVCQVPIGVVLCFLSFDLLI